MATQATTRRGRPGEDLDRDLVIGATALVVQDVLEIRLRSTDGPHSWRPSAHIDLRVGEQGWRQYSLCGDRDDRATWSVPVCYDGSRRVRGCTRPSTPVTDRGSRSARQVRPRPCEPVRVRHRGTGITPMRPMIPAVEHSGADWQLVYGGQRRDRMVFAAELSERYGDKVRHVFRRCRPGRRAGERRGVRLAGAIFTAHNGHGVGIARRIHTGTVGINGYAIDNAAPFGGHRQSDLGSELGSEGLSAYLQYESVYHATTY